MKRLSRLGIAPGVLSLCVLLGPPAGAAGDAPRVVEIVAKRFEFSPKEVTLRKGEPVTFRFRSEDVTHGFLVKKLKLDIDIVPGKPVEATITPDTPGTYTAICNHFCGAGHGGMKMRIVVE